MSNKQLFEQIMNLSGESPKAEIGALFREFQDIKSSQAIDILKIVYKNNMYSEERYKSRTFLDRQLIKDNFTYIRRCAILALIEHSKNTEDLQSKDAINFFLFSCINDNANEVRQAILNVAPKEFNEAQLIESYNKIRSVADAEKVQSKMEKDEHIAIRRGIIRALGEKISLSKEKERQTILKFIYSTIQSPRDTDPYVCAASAEILGVYGTQKHIETLENLAHLHEYPVHLRAEKAINKIKKRESSTGDTKKLLLYEKIKTLQSTINILQKECEQYKKQLEEL